MMNTDIINALFNDNKWLASFIVFFLFIALRWLTVRLIKKYQKGEDVDPKRWINIVNNLTSLLVIISLVVIWLSELRFIALSIAAFAVALVVATREQIQCFLGALYIAGSRAFGVGDWIKVSHYHGEVVSSDLLTTTLLEVDIEDKSYSYTGKTLVVPNNLFVGGVVQNLNFMRRYVSHSFSITKENNPIDIRLAREFLISRAEFYCEPFKNVAERYGSLIENRLGVSLGMDSASVRVTTNSTAKNVFIISFFCPTQEAVHIEQKILEDFFDYWDKSAKKVKISERNKDDGEIHDLNHHE